MIHKTQGIVLRVVKYGETSIICSVFTELLGLQSYMVKGVRSEKKTGQKANVFFPSSLLNMVVYQKPHQELNMIKECYPAAIYRTIQEEVLKNCVALFAVEVVRQLLVHNDPQPDFFLFLKQYFLKLDETEVSGIANFPLFLLIQAGRLSGYYMSGSYTEDTPYADLQEGRYSKNVSAVSPPIWGEEAVLMSRLNAAMTAEEIAAIKMTGKERQAMLHYFVQFMQLHAPHFKPLKSLPVLVSILY